MHPEKCEVSKILPVFEEEDVNPMSTLPVPKPPTFAQQMVARQVELANARQRAMVSPIQQFYGKQ